MPADSTDESTGDALETIFYRTDRIRFVYWQQFSGGRATVAIIGLLTLLSFVTGLSTLSQEMVVLEGPLADLVPEVTTLVRFGGVLSAVLLGIITVGLNRQKRVAWYGAIVLLPLIGLLPLLTLQSTHIPLLLFVLFAVPLLVLNRAHFTEPMDLTPLQIAALSSVAGALAYGTIGAYAIREQFQDLQTWSDAVYYVLVTIATVGYGDITPLTTQAKWFSLSVIVFGTGAFTAAIGALIVPAIEKRMATAFGNMTPSSLRLLEDHILVLGYSDITDALLESFEDEIDVVVVTPNSDEASDLDAKGTKVLTADPTEEETLQDAGMAHARGVVIGTRDDAQDVLAVLATRKVNPDVRIVASANEARNADKLKDVGADHVISPSEIGGRLLGRAVLTAEEDQGNDVLEWIAKSGKQQS